MKTTYFGIYILVLLVSFGCKPVKYEYKKVSGFAQGSAYHITYENRKEKDYSDDISALLKKFDKSLSIFDSTSIISRINHNEPNVVVDDWFETVFNKSAEINRLSGGAFDITVGPVVKAWGFTTAPVAKHDSSYIDSLLQFVGMKYVKLENQHVIKAIPGVQLDVNALAQGYSVDLVCDFFNQKGIKNYLVEIGGEVRGKGVNASGKPWRIGIDKPIDGSTEPGNDLEAIVEINNLSISTSGNYRKYYIENGVKYSHEINPFTGRPAKNSLLSASVVAEDCITADALATTFMVLGVEKSKQLLQNLKGVDVFFVYNGPNGEYKTFYTPGMEKMIIKIAE
jgi:FAD:protein FMN transferase